MSLLVVDRHKMRRGLRSTQSGFNMIEVMVTMGVLSIGLLGLAALQSMGVRFNSQSYQRTQAVFQAYDLVDRMSANWQCIASGCAYDAVAAGFIPSSPPTCISATGASTCTPANIATSDVAQWNTRNAAVLTGGRGAVCRGTLDAAFACTAAAAGVPRYSIAVAWRENDLNMRIDVQVDLCNPVLRQCS